MFGAVSVITGDALRAFVCASVSTHARPCCSLVFARAPRRWGHKHVIFRVCSVCASSHVTGLVGTIGGGLLLDVVARVLKRETQEAALLLSVVLMCVAWPLTVMAFCAPTYHQFLVYMFLGQLVAFATTSPVNGVLLWYERAKYACRRNTKECVFA